MSISAMKAQLAAEAIAASAHSCTTGSDDEEVLEHLLALCLSAEEMARTAALGWWCTHGFPVIKVSHAVAADLMLSVAASDVVDDVRPPWPSFVIELPPDLLPLPDGSAVVLVLVASASTADGDPWHLIAYTNDDESVGREVIRWSWRDLAAEEGDPAPLVAELGEELGTAWHRVGRLIEALVLNVTLAATERGQQGPGQGLVQQRSAPARRKPWQRLSPAMTTYVLGTPVHINMRTDEEKKILLDCFRSYVRTGSASTVHRELGVQLVRRGHWRNQAYGPRHSLRRRQWIAPHPVGRPDAPRVLRPHVLINDDAA